MKTHTLSRLLPAVVMLLMLVIVPGLGAQQFSIVANFTGELSNVNSLVSDGAGNFWGTAGEGGAYNVGAVIKINASTGIITTIQSFDYSINPTDNNRGGSPYSRLVSDGSGNFWGTTSGGGVYGDGTVFKINVATGAITTMVDFDGTTTAGDNSRGSDPAAGLTSDGAGNFWGTTFVGGESGYGTVFKVNISTGAITTVVDFD